MGDLPDVTNKIKELRARFDLTQEALAISVNVTRQTIISIEKNEYVPSLTLGMKIAKVFNLKVEDVFTLEI